MTSPASPALAAAPAAGVLDESGWQRRRSAHRARMGPLVQPRLARRSRGHKHPVDDFMFDYYSFPAGRLLAWHPGLGVVLAGVAAAPEHVRYLRVPGGRTADPAAAPRQLPRWQRNLAILRATAGREPGFGCFGLHEWAMVLDQEPAELRHAPAVLRVDQAQVRQTIRDVGLRCTHFDAYRFFSRTASTRQRRLTPQDRFDAEQPACLHAGMDVYRFAYEASPYLPSELVADAFVHARQCREVDMRASPYDLTAWGVAPIPVETPAGRREYVALQRALAVRSAELREQVAHALQVVIAAAADMAD